MLPVDEVPVMSISQQLAVLVKNLVASRRIAVAEAGIRVGLFSWMLVKLVVQQA
jgi:hypothetical protein